MMRVMLLRAEHSEVELLKMNRDIFIYLTGVSHSEMNMLDVDSVNTAVATILTNIGGI